MNRGRFLVGVCWLSVVILTGCDPKHYSNDEEIVTKDQQKFQGFGKFFGDDALLFGDHKIGKAPDVGIGVNTYLWRATLRVLSFMPLKTIDPFGGVIMSDWYEDPRTPDERIRVDVRILDRVLRADALVVSVFRERRDGTRYRSIAVSPKTTQDLEDAILTEARRLKVEE